MKKFLVFIGLFFFAFGAFADVVNKTQLFRSDHWIYDALATLETETKHPIFTETAPITAGEIEFYFKTIDREALSESGKATYDEIAEFLGKKPFGFYGKEFGVAVNPYLNPEFYYKSNEKIPWSFRYFYKDNIATAPIRVGISDYFTGGLDLFLGKNFDAASDNNAFCNMPFSLNDSEFSQPTWAYGSAGITFENWGVGLVCAREGLKVGKTLLGSIIYNNTFETQSFVQFNIYTPYFKYNLDTIQVNTEKYIYLHHFEFQLFNRLKFMFIEGTLITGAFEIKNLNPFMIMHSFGIWGEEWSDDLKSAQYMAFLLEFCPTKNLKIYGLMAQNEVAMPYEKNDGHPTSIGFQLGLDAVIPSAQKGYWKGTIEGLWTMPYLYIKQTEANTFYSNRSEMQGKSKTIQSWMGTPYGPDCMGFAIEAGYEAQRKWSAKLGYSLVAHGENGFNLINGKSEHGEDYYPNIRYKKQDASEEEKQKALDDAENLFPSGTVEFTQRIKLSGSYYFNKHAQLNAQAMFINVINCGNISGETENGVELALSVKCELF